MRKPVLVALALIVLLTACGKKEANVTLGNTSASPGATSSAKPGATAAAKKSAAPGASKAPSGVTSTASTNAATPKPASQGGANLPKDGNYVYRMDGTSDSPFTGKQTYNNQTVTGSLSHSGNIYTTKTSSSNSGSAETKTEWDPTKILLVSIKGNQGGTEFSCVFNPRPVIAHIPQKAETFPQQKLQGSGNACDGTLDIQVIDKENVADATGKTWSTWKVHVKTVSHVEFQGQKFTANSDQMRWVSPDLGVEIKQVTDSSTKSAAGATVQSGHITTVLKSHP
jgi:hypothetical protein